MSLVHCAATCHTHCVWVRSRDLTTREVVSLMASLKHCTQAARAGKLQEGQTGLQEQQANK